MQWYVIYMKIQHRVDRLPQGDLYLKLHNSLSENDPVLLDLSTKINGEKSAHSVLAYGMVDLMDDRVAVLIYDPNVPREATFFTIDKYSSDPAQYISPYGYNFSVVGTESISDLSRNIFYAIGRTEGDLLMMFLDPVDNYIIRKASGEYVDPNDYIDYRGFDYELLALPLEDYTIELSGSHYSSYLWYIISDYNIVAGLNISVDGDYSVDNIVVNSDGQIKIDLSGEKIATIKYDVVIIDPDNMVIKESNLTMTKYTSGITISLKPVSEYGEPIILLSIDTDGDSEPDYSTRITGTKILGQDEILEKIKEQISNQQSITPTYLPEEPDEVGTSGMEIKNTSTSISRGGGLALIAYLETVLIIILILLLLLVFKREKSGSK